MNKIYDFIKNCECFYVATINDEFPAVRPFGAIMEVSGFLYIATHDGNISNCPDHLHLGGSHICRKKYRREKLVCFFTPRLCRAARVSQCVTV